MSNKQKVICDTNIYIYASWGYQPAVQLINELRFDIELLMPTIVQVELLSIPRTQKDLSYKDVIEEYIEYPKSEGLMVHINDNVAKNAADIRILWFESEGKKLPSPDAIIAATSIDLDAQLYSNNDKDFVYAAQHFGLKFENPINRNDLEKFMKENELAHEESDIMDTAMRVLAKMDEESLRELSYKSIGLLNDQAKKEQIKFARGLKKRRSES
ncbi:type II toxin-antitoxin system VapC family toxin [Paenibacillus sp. Leaf72]|uniref:type II toxin-antitoxin system VapC family toxin n=1 Tax=Paenibacillus sp. Leaf72 TaxID=1736234 RepID=UPI0006F55093|nr:PIN domain-containing protein [Paenibacillus sp. Leaf72]KQO12454.1 hypothetical protein ASF12_31050 [Paenibacillus sp. Leaf72]